MKIPKELEGLTFMNLDVWTIPVGVLHNACNHCIDSDLKPTGQTFPHTRNYIEVLNLRTKKHHGYQLTVKGMLARLDNTGTTVGGYVSHGKRKRNAEPVPKGKRTFDKWSSMGYRIIKGSRAEEFNGHDEALFSHEQVWKPKK